MAGDVPATLDWKELWEEASGRFSKKPCLTVKGRFLTYSELDEVSQRCASLLLSSKGWRSGALVALPVNSPEFFPKLLSIWHAGGVSVPTLEQASESDFLWDGTHPRRLREELPFSSSGWHALYRTSGSTGTPRAVVRGWKQAIYEAGQYAALLGLTEGMSCTMLVNPVFGASTKHFLGCLLSGCHQSFSCFESPAERTDGDLIHGTPSQMISLGEDENPGRFGVISLTGEPLSLRSLQAVRKLCRPGGTCLNALGGSETGVLINAITPRHELEELEEPVLRGRGLAGKNLRIVDENGDQVLLGETGLLEVSSEWIAEGYLDRDDQDLRFTPFLQSGGSRVFRTGDLVVGERDGRLRHLGRSGSMIKHRGKWLDTLPLKEALLHEGADVVHIGRNITGSGLKVWIHTGNAKIGSLEHLATILCEKMGNSSLLPETLVSLSEIPLNGHGKTDLGALERIENLGGVSYFNIPSRAVRLADAIVNQRWDDPALGGAVHIVDLQLDSLEQHEMLVELEGLAGKSLTGRILTGDVPLRETFSALANDPGNPVQCLGGSGAPLLLWFGDGLDLIRREYGDDIRILHWNVTQFPGPGNSSGVRSLTDLAKKMLGMVDTSDLDGKIIVGGYSFGALLARESAVILREHGKNISGVLILDPPDPARHHIRNAIRWSRWRPFIVCAILRSLPSSWLNALGGMLRTRLFKETHRHREEQRRFLMRNYCPSMSGNLRETLFTSRAEHQGSVQLLSQKVSNLEILPLGVAEHLHVLTEPAARNLWLNSLGKMLAVSRSPNT